MTGSVRIGVLAGDGIGPEVTAQATRVLAHVGDLCGVRIEFEHGLLGGAAVDRAGSPLPAETLALATDCAALLVGSVGGPAWDALPPEQNPGIGGLLALRRGLDLFANLRPGVSHLPEISPLRRAEQIDLLLVRESTGGIYFSPDRGRNLTEGVDTAWDLMTYDETTVARVAHAAFELAAGRRGQVTSVDKANVLMSSQLWRSVVSDVAAAYPQVELEHLYVDNAATQLVLRPAEFDVILTENLFGDILSDEVAGIVGSLGLVPSATLRGDTFGLYEPVHGSAPELAGTNTANPVAAILSAALLLRHSAGMPAAAASIESAVQAVLSRGWRTADLAGSAASVGTREFGDLIVEELTRQHDTARASA